jgi:hypothetical protein
MRDIRRVAKLRAVGTEKNLWNTADLRIPAVVARQKEFHSEFWVQLAELLKIVVHCGAHSELFHSIVPVLEPNSMTLIDFNRIQGSSQEGTFSLNTQSFVPHDF